LRSRFTARPWSPRAGICGTAPRDQRDGASRRPPRAQGERSRRRAPRMASVAPRSCWGLSESQGGVRSRGPLPLPRRSPGCGREPERGRMRAPAPALPAQGATSGG
jgi:hypothetical protein